MEQFESLQTAKLTAYTPSMQGNKVSIWPCLLRRVIKFDGIFLETQFLQILIYHYFKDYIIQQASFKSFKLRRVFLLSVEVPKKAKQSRESETPRNSN